MVDCCHGHMGLPMKFLSIRKDGGPESHTTGLFLVEIKSLFTIVLLRFSPGTRPAYHSHAFNAVSWLLKGRLVEFQPDRAACIGDYLPSVTPIYTPRERFHQVVSKGTSWAISFRGPWAKEWQEYIPTTNQSITLTHGRKQVHV